MSRERRPHGQAFSTAVIVLVSCMCVFNIGCKQEKTVELEVRSTTDELGVGYVVTTNESRFSNSTVVETPWTKEIDLEYSTAQNGRINMRVDVESGMYPTTQSATAIVSVDGDKRCANSGSGETFSFSVACSENY